MLNKEKIMGFLKNPEFKFWTIASLLTAIILIQVYYCYQIFELRGVLDWDTEKNIRLLRESERSFNRALNRKNQFGMGRRKENIKKLEKIFEKELSELEEENDRAFGEELRERGRAEGNFDRKLDEKNTMQRSIKQKNFIFRPRSEYSEEKKEFTVNLRLPQNLKLEDVNIKFEKNILVIFIEESKKTENSFFYNSFTRKFEIPNTKATRNDLKINLENQLLKITAPIF
ncbi:MAG: Hsp20/alpha crystallin family protein [Rickettsiales bacterium]|jgi:hypothetical protein|nr:Hsp20/alpha crystallin family protein [Rickettsiales bacterium]